MLCMSVNLQHNMLLLVYQHVLLEVNQQHVVVGLPTCVVGGKHATIQCARTISITYGPSSNDCLVSVSCYICLNAHASGKNHRRCKRARFVCSCR